MTFEESMAELERLVADLERGDAPLDTALANYEKGVTLIKACLQKLNEAEAKVRELAATDSDGQPNLKPFDDGPGAELTTAKRPSRRKE
jgi:exodeoxyribonuclease VII small subunit